MCMRAFHESSVHVVRLHTTGRVYWEVYQGQMWECRDHYGPNTHTHYQWTHTGIQQVVEVQSLHTLGVYCSNGLVVC